MSVISRSVGLAFAVAISGVSARVFAQRPVVPQQAQKTLHPPAPQITEAQRAALARIALAHRIPEVIVSILQHSDCVWASIPEYDDVQPFVVGNKYGALVSVFGCGGLKKKAPSDFAKFLLVSQVFVDPTVGSQTTPPYKNLHIDAGKSHCLYLHWTGGTSWEGLMTPAAGPCPMNPAAGAVKNLDVLAIENDEPMLELPESARLMPAQHGNSGYIGVRCADRWCVIGAKIKDYDEKHPDKRAHPWYDFQNLGVKTSGAPKPSGLTAYVTADENLETLTIAEFKSGYRKVATVHVDAGVIPTKYADAGFVTGKNTIYVKILTEGTAPTSSTSGTPGTGEAIIVNAKYPSGKKVLKVMRHVFPAAFDTPAVARWGWNPMDEDVWIRCDMGCCMVEMT